ncbi:MAG: CRR6 family NdhI maturation factor [Cyanobacteriota bacterium]|nr:CRR6 family NdhI maturation factor [Cyanobacteriota bacterium]
MNPSKQQPPHSLAFRGYGPVPTGALSHLLIAEPPTAGPLIISAAAIRGLDLTPLAPLAGRSPQHLVALGACLSLEFDWPLASDDPRERSEIAELRLWSLRADALCPWLPLLLDRSNGQLARHVAMLLPHGFSRTEGLRFAPESLELWITHRLFLLDAWAQADGLNLRQGLGQMAAVLGFELDPAFWDPMSPG